MYPAPAAAEPELLTYLTDAAASRMSRVGLAPRAPRHLLRILKAPGRDRALWDLQACTAPESPMARLNSHISAAYDLVASVTSVDRQTPEMDGSRRPTTRT